MSRFPRWWFWAAVLVPAVVTAVGLTIQTSGIEKDVRESVEAAVPGAVVTAYGRDVTVAGLQIERMPEARMAAANARGVRDVVTLTPGLRPMKLTFHADQVVVTGASGKDEWRKGLVAALQQQAHGRTVVDRTRTVADTDFPLTTTAAEIVVAVLTQQSSDLTVDVDNGQVTVTGVVPDPDKRAVVISVLRRFLGAALVDHTKIKE
jgi:hypothetical protein